MFVKRLHARYRREGIEIPEPVRIVRCPILPVTDADPRPNVLHVVVDRNGAMRDNRNGRSEGGPESRGRQQ